MVSATRSVTFIATYTHSNEKYAIHRLDSASFITWFNMTSWNNTENISPCKMKEISVITTRQDRLSCICGNSEFHFNIFPIHSTKFVSKAIAANINVFYKQIVSGNEDRDVILIDFLNNKFAIYSKKTWHEFNFKPNSYYPLGLYYEDDELYVIVSVFFHGITVRLLTRIDSSVVGLFASIIVVQC